MKINIHLDGSLLEARVRVSVDLDDGGTRAVRPNSDDDTGEVFAELARLGFVINETGDGMVAREGAALEFWTREINVLPDEWDLYASESLVYPEVHRR